MNVKTKSKWDIIRLCFIIIFLSSCAFAVMIGMRDADINVSDNKIQIKGMYGTNIEYTDVENITLLQKSMKEIGIGRRTNGFGGIGNTCKGNYESESLGKYMLFVNSSSSPTILIERSNNKNVYISFKDSKKTRILYSKLDEMIK